MSSNDGQKLLVFGISFAQHDNRKMQQILRHYNRMPANPGSRAALFVELNNLAKELGADEAAQGQIQQLTGWVKNGGDFPLAMAPSPVNASELHGLHEMPTGAQEVSGRTPPARASANGGYRRYGRGRTLDGAVEADDENRQNLPSETASQHSNDSEDDGGSDEEANGVDDEDGDDGEASRAESDDKADPAPVNPTLDRWEEDDEMDRSAEAGPFHGRGRTLSDYEESGSAIVPNGLIAAPTAGGTFNSGLGTAIPQLRHNQAWRGNNVVGLGGMMGRHIPRPHQMPGRRPPMEDDEEEDDWGAGRQLGFGPARTLSDPEPALLDEHHNQNESSDRSNNSSRSDGPEDADPDPEGTGLQLNSAAYDTSSAPDVADDAEAEEMECPICIGQYPPSFFPKTPTITELCDHPDKACLQCISASISEIMKRGALHLLACPICPQKLTRKDVREYASKEVYERYIYLKQQSEIPGHWISCTNPSCGGSQPHDSKGPSGPKMVCNHCQFETCAKHRRPWHTGQSCTEFDMDPAQIERLEEEEATAKLLSQEATSICPKCGQGVTKTDGCDHMACQCGTEWCYACSCSWENILRIGNTAHATFCIYHPNKVNLTKAQQERARSRIMGLVHGGEVSAELTMARDEFRQRRREEMRPKVAEAAEARRMKALEQQKRDGEGEKTGVSPTKKKRKVKLVAPWEEDGWTKKAFQ